ncbi:MAG: hypothetical protein ACTHZ5_02485 [Micrococcaceae bacterium]
MPQERQLTHAKTAAYNSGTLDQAAAFHAALSRISSSTDPDRILETRKSHGVAS